MKKNRNNRKENITGFFIFLLTSSFIVTFAVLIYDKVSKESNNVLYLSLILIICIIILSIVMLVFDIFRRKIMIDKPVNEILAGTEKIINGDFSVQFKPIHRYGKYDEYDLIMDNLNKVAKELSKNELLKNDFISNVSHEIKTPLSIIKLYATELQNDELDEAVKEEYVNTIIKASDGLSLLVSNILKLNKLDNQAIFDEKKRISIASSIENSILNFETLLDSKGIDLECHLEEDVFMYADVNLLEIIWNNLISNAIKFSNQNGKIIIRLESLKDYISVSVKDFGIGMTKETGQRIFDKFYQGDSSHKIEGNGLGLALVKKVIDVIGGQISVDSKLNEGSIFVVRLKTDA